MTKQKQSNTPQPLSPKEKSVLEYIEQYLSENGVAPTFTEIRDNFGFASYNSVQNYLKQLVSKGYIHLPGDNQKRAIHLLHPSFAAKTHLHQLQSTLPQTTSAPSRSPREEEPLLGSTKHEEVLSLPLLGKVAAGKPIEAFAYDEYVDVPPSMIRNASKTFALKVQGQSMIEDGILDGDIILVQKQVHANNGEIVVAIVDNEATVKRFFLGGKPDKGLNIKSIDRLVELRPSNSTMTSMWYRQSQVEVRGIVVGLLRKF